MNVTDLTENFIEDVLHRSNVAAYEARTPALFKHYLTYWAPRSAAYSRLIPREIRKRSRLIKSKLEMISRCLRGKDIFNFPDIFLFVGKGTSNGHAMRMHNKYSVWLPVEKYSTSKQVEIFVTHEILHAVHYKHQPDLYFLNKKEKENTTRLLITEGVATYLSACVMKVKPQEALWADYLSKDLAEAWLTKCEKNSDRLWALSKKALTGSNISSQMFYANDSHDVLKFRAGYWIGYQVVKAVVERYELDEKKLLALSSQDFKIKALTIIKTRGV